MEVIQGRYFGYRNRLAGMSAFIALVSAGVILHLLARAGIPQWGFFTTFVLAFLARLNSVRWLARYQDPPFSITEGQVFTFSQFLTFRYWGGISDRFGNKKILNVCGLGVAVVPMLWLVSHWIPYLLAIQIFSGVVWSGSIRSGPPRFFKFRIRRFHSMAGCMKGPRIAATHQVRISIFLLSVGRVLRNTTFRTPFL